METEIRQPRFWAHFQFTLWPQNCPQIPRRKENPWCVPKPTPTSAPLASSAPTIGNSENSSQRDLSQRQVRAYILSAQSPLHSFREKAKVFAMVPKACSLSTPSLFSLYCSLQPHWPSQPRCTSGHLHMLFPLSRMPCPQTSQWLTPFTLCRFLSNVTFSMTPFQSSYLKLQLPVLQPLQTP